MFPVLLEKISSEVVLCRVKRSEAEGKDSGTFSLCCVQYEPHQSLPAYISEAETLDLVKKVEARRATAGISLIRKMALWLFQSCSSSGSGSGRGGGGRGGVDRVRDLLTPQVRRKQRLRMALVGGGEWGMRRLGMGLARNATKISAHICCVTR